MKMVFCCWIRATYYVFLCQKEEERLRPLGNITDGSVRGKRRGVGILASSSSNVAAQLRDGWFPDKGFKAPSLNDIVWPSTGAFAAMAILGKMDQMLATKGNSIIIAPLGVVCVVLFATHSSPAARG